MKHQLEIEHANWINLHTMERFTVEGIDFAFPTQTLHLAGDDKRPLKIGQRWETEEETFSPSTILAQATALGARAALSGSFPASVAVFIGSLLFLAALFYALTWYENKKKSRSSV